MHRTLALLVLAACGTTTPEPPPAAPAPPPEVAVAPAKGAWETFGAPFEVSEVIAAGTLIGDPAPFVGKKLMVEGEVADVCQKAGCWMVVTDGARNMRVRMKDHGFAVAKDCTGATARVHGEVVALEVKPDDVAHFAGEAARPEVMPEKALPADATVTYELVASAVQIQR